MAPLPTVVENDFVQMIVLCSLSTTNFGVRAIGGAPQIPRQPIFDEGSDILVADSKPQRIHRPVTGASDCLSQQPEIGPIVQVIVEAVL